MNSKRKKYNISPYVVSRDVAHIEEKTGNVYESINIIAKRSKQLGGNLKDELHNKLNEFASSTDSLEEIHENKEQIEISKFYERMPHPVLLALEEFMSDKVYHRNTGMERRKKKAEK